MIALTSETGSGNTVTGYISGFHPEEVDVLASHPAVVGLVPVVSVPASLLSPTACLDLVSRAENAGLAWQLSPWVSADDGLSTSLRVYARPVNGEREKIVDVSWSGGRMIGGGVPVDVARARICAAAVSGRDAA